MAPWTKGRCKGGSAVLVDSLAELGLRRHFWREKEREAKMTTKSGGLRREKASSLHTLTACH